MNRTVTRVIYCPTCANELPVEEYDNPRVRSCPKCKTVFEFLERPASKFVVEEE